MPEITQEQQLMLAKISQARLSPKEYEAMLRDMPDKAKRVFVEMDVAALREYSLHSVKKRLQDAPELAKLLSSVDVRNIADQIYENVREDQQKVKDMLANSSKDGDTTKGSAWGQHNERRRVVRR